jgi:hypothetical protein
MMLSWWGLRTAKTLNPHQTQSQKEVKMFAKTYLPILTMGMGLMLTMLITLFITLNMAINMAFGP